MACLFFPLMTAAQTPQADADTGSLSYRTIAYAIQQVAFAGLASRFPVRFWIIDDSLPSIELGAGWDGAECLVVINPNMKSRWRSILVGIAPEDRQTFFEALLAHELAHCDEAIRIERTFSAEHQVAPQLRHLHIGSAREMLRLSRNNEQIRWSEAKADLAAVLYLRQCATERSDRLIMQLAQMRDRQTSFDPGHATSGFLWRARYAPHGANPDVFEESYRLRTLLASSAALND